MSALIDWDSPDEQWAPIPGHEGYEASTHGRVRSPRGVLKPWTSNRLGHLKIGLSGGRREWLHRVICLAFYGPCPPELEVRHLDGNPTNNHVHNLRYGTHSENMADKVRHGTVPMRYDAECPRGHAYGPDRICWKCQYVAKKAWVHKNVGTYIDCDNCGRAISKLNLTRHKRTLRCLEGAR